MFAELTCGKCEAHMQVDAEDNDEGVWSLLWRFANNHTTATCGGMFTGGIPTDSPADVKLVPRPRPGGDDGGEEATL